MAWVCKGCGVRGKRRFTDGYCVYCRDASDEEREERRKYLEEKHERRQKPEPIGEQITIQEVTD